MTYMVVSAGSELKPRSSTSKSSIPSGFLHLSIGLVIKFLQVFPSHYTEKPKWTFWLTQYQQKILEIPLKDEKWSEIVSHSVMSDSLRPHGLQSTHSSVHGILQAGTLEWVAIPFSGRSSTPRDQTRVSLPLALHGKSHSFHAEWASKSGLHAREDMRLHISRGERQIIDGHIFNPLLSWQRQHMCLSLLLQPSQL